MTVSDQDLKQAMTIAAKIINLYGDKYWPLFDRLESELEKRKNRKSKLRAALKSLQKEKQHESTNYH